MEGISHIRKEYKLSTLDVKDVSPDPMVQFAKWWNEAVESNIDEVNAMTLSTATASGAPSARIVLLKGFDGGGFTFYTNYQSQKGSEMGENNWVALTFYWKELERQINISGVVEKVSPSVSDAYFQSRPLGSRIGAWTSNQSSPIPSREYLEAREKELISSFGENVPRPPHWGGYLVRPHVIEFWQGRPSRLHDRIEYTLSNGLWAIQRLAP